MKLNSKKIINSILLTALASFVSNNVESKEVCTYNSEQNKKDEIDAAVNYNGRVIKNVLKISPNGSSSYVASHRSHRSHFSHRSSSSGGHMSHISSSYVPPRKSTNVRSSSNGTGYRGNSGIYPPQRSRLVKKNVTCTSCFGRKTVNEICINCNSFFGEKNYSCKFCRGKGIYQSKCGVCSGTGMIEKYEVKNY